MKSIDFDPVSGFYDNYASPSFDLAFWRDLARRSPPPTLELMCGTGRITMGLLEAGVEVEALDYSAGMLARFREKIAAAGRACTLYEADARAFDLPRHYGLIYIGFHAIAEVLDDADKLRVFACARRHLAPGGAFWVSLHNPPVRRKTLDGEERSFGPCPRTQEGEDLAVSAAFSLDEATGLVTGVQRYRMSRDGRETRQLELPVRFHLLDPARLEALLAQAGFHVRVRLGSYAGEQFVAATSPVLIVGCEASSSAD